MASIKIPIGTDNTGLDAGAAKAEKRLNKFKGAVVRNFAAIAGAVGIVGMLDKLSERLDRIGKISRRGLDVDFLQKLDLLAQTSGTNLESAAKAVSMFVKEIRSADGPSAEIAASIQALGLNLEDLKKLDSQQLFVTVATAIGNLDNETDRLAATTGVLGTRYGDLLPLIQDIAHKGMPELTTATKEQIQEIEAANDQWTTAKMVLSTKLAPVLILIARLAQTLSLAIESATNKFVIFSSAVIGNAMSLKQTLEGVFELDKDKIAAGLQGAKDTFGQFVKDAKRDFKDGVGDLKDIWTPEKISEGQGNGVTGDNKFNAGAQSGDDAIAAAAAEYESEQARRRELGKEREKARTEAERARDSRRDELMDEGRDIAGGVRSRRAALDAPGNITVSSMRSIGGGGGVALPNEQKVLRVNEAQLKRLGEIYQEIKRLNMESGSKAFK